MWGHLDCPFAIEGKNIHAIKSLNIYMKNFNDKFRKLSQRVLEVL